MKNRLTHKKKSTLFCDKKPIILNDFPFCVFKMWQMKQSEERKIQKEEVPLAYSDLIESSLTHRCPPGLQER